MTNVLFDASHLSRTELFTLILCDVNLHATVKKAALASPDLPWRAIDVHELVLDALDLDLDLDDASLFGSLVVMVNIMQSLYAVESAAHLQLAPLCYSK